jgi:hypothetical protein
MVFANGEDVQADLVGEPHLLNEIRHPILR